MVFYNDPENGLRCSKTGKLWIIKQWSHLPLVYKIFIAFIVSSLSYLIFFWSSIPNYSFSNEALHRMGFKEINYRDLYILSVDNFNDNEISWIRDIINNNSNKLLINDKQKKIIDATKHSWYAYKHYAWGYDFLKPITRTGYNWFNVGITIIDSLDTLLLMDLRDEFDEAFRWIYNHLSFNINKDVNCFEMTIRILGGLLSSFHLTKSQIFKIKSLDIGNRLIHCFDSSSKIPFSDINLKSMKAKSPVWSADSSISEVCSIQLEFRDLSMITYESKFEMKSFQTSQYIHNLTRTDSLVPVFINPINGMFTSSKITLGARGDSYYEYLLKQYIQTSIRFFLDDYINAINEIQSRLLQTTKGILKLVYIGELTQSNIINPKMDHLACFLPGTLALGYYHYSNDPLLKKVFNDHLSLAKSLIRTCYFMYNLTDTGLSPEIVYFNEDDTDIDNELQIRSDDTHNLLRPEFIESLFYLYHVTGDKMYREQGWQIFKSFETFSKVKTGGYTSISNVRNAKSVKPRDMQDSYWISETLKYFYLLFSDDKFLISKILNNYIFNTEGHLILRKSIFS